MPKVYLSPSNQGSNPCKHGDSEKDHCNLLTDALIPYLDACGIEYKRAGKSESITDRVKASNSWKADVHYCIHTNAGGGKRSVLYGWDKTNATWLKLANAIKKYRAEIYPREIRFSQNQTFYEIKQTTAKCMYDEVLFHDNTEEAEFLHENFDPLAKRIAQGLCEYFGIAFRSPAADTPEIPDAPEAPCECDTLREQLRQAEEALASVSERLNRANTALRQINALSDEV